MHRVEKSEPDNISVSYVCVWFTATVGVCLPTDLRERINVWGLFLYEVWTCAYVMNRTVNCLCSPIPPIPVKSCLHLVTPSVAFAYQEAVRKISGVKTCETGNCSRQEGQRHQCPQNYVPSKGAAKVLPWAATKQQARWTWSFPSQALPWGPPAALGAVTQLALTKPCSENKHTVTPGLWEM